MPDTALTEKFRMRNRKTKGKDRMKNAKKNKRRKPSDKQNNYLSKIIHTLNVMEDRLTRIERTFEKLQKHAISEAERTIDTAVSRAERTIDALSKP
jgi:hypothetical protein